MPAKRASQAELIARREEIRGLIAMGVPHTVIKKDMAQKYVTSERAIADDMRLIAQEWKKVESEDVKSKKNQYAERLEFMFGRAVANNEDKLALEIQKEMHKLNGLYQEKEKQQEKMPTFINVSKRSDLKIVGDSE